MPNYFQVTLTNIKKNNVLSVIFVFLKPEKNIAKFKKKTLRMSNT